MLSALQRGRHRQQKGEEALRESELRYRMLFETTRDAIFVLPVTPEGKPSTFTAVNDTACEILGYSREELLSLRPGDIVPPDQHDRMLALGPVLMRDRYVRAEWDLITKKGGGRSSICRSLWRNCQDSRWPWPWSAT